MELDTVPKKTSGKPSAQRVIQGFLVNSPQQHLAPNALDAPEYGSAPNGARPNIDTLVPLSVQALYGAVSAADVV